MKRLLPLVLLAFAIHVAHQALLGDWIVDDAGISYAYARSLAQGHGLVAQPGVPPVEGFTNLLWVAILAVPMALGVFDPVVAPKVLGAVLVLAAFVLTARLVHDGGRRPAWLAGAALALTAGIPGFAIWCASGLENALYAATLAWLATLCARGPAIPAATAGVVVFLVSCTRPDGVLYLWLPAFMMGLQPDASRRAVARYAAAFCLPWAALTVFRAAYFRDLMPNTFYAKQAEGSIFFEWLTREWPLAAAAPAAVLACTAGVIVLAAGAWTAGRRLRTRTPADAVRRRLPVLFAITAVVVYHALRSDWMGEFRFATPAFLFAPAGLLAWVWDAAAGRAGAPRARFAAAGVALAAAVGVAAYAVPHTAAFLARPTLSFAAVVETSEHIDGVLAPTGGRPTVMTPDIGGALWLDRYEVVDYLGLIDRTIGRRRTFDRRTMRDYIIDVRHPDAVYLHSHFLRRSGLHADAGFRAAYDAVSEGPAQEDGLPAWALYHRQEARGAR